MDHLALFGLILTLAFIAESIPVQSELDSKYWLFFYIFTALKKCEFVFIAPLGVELIKYSKINISTCSNNNLNYLYLKLFNVYLIGPNKIKPCRFLTYIDRVPYFYKQLKACFSYLHANKATFVFFIFTNGGISSELQNYLIPWWDLLA